MKKRYRLICLLLLLLLQVRAVAQLSEQETMLKKTLTPFFNTYQPVDQLMRERPKLVSIQLNDSAQTLRITANNRFSEQSFTPESTANIYKKVRALLPAAYRNYEISIVTNDYTIDELIPNRLKKNIDKQRAWGNIDYQGHPWVLNESRPNKITRGLQNRHIALWASHGRYYDQTKRQWRWQRPKLFATTEDLFTQTIVVPYLIPMLENAGAVVFTPRERDWQTHEVIVDNDNKDSGYMEIAMGGKWQNTSLKGFAYHDSAYVDGENPFEAGTARMIKTTDHKYKFSLACYQPTIPKAGKYAVYVSYQTVENSVDDALYTVWHRGERTRFRVNQQMGGGTWVYLGTFDFDAGSSEYNRVTVSSQNSQRGRVVTTDAVRFGGGMGNIKRGDSISGMPRALEGARYYAQWAGMPYAVYSSKEGTDDYGDDINARSLMTNYLGGGSPFMPKTKGKQVPIELSLAVHSDAGYAKSDNGLIGSLAICTTHHNNKLLNADISRLASRDFADALLNGEIEDIKYKYGKWNRREIFDRNYSETRLPDVPSAILETMSHQNFPDMRMGQDPHFRFTLARSIYKSILRYVSEQHKTPYVVSPLAPTHFRIEFKNNDEIELSWTAVNDPQEPSATPTGYVLYTAIDGTAFDNGTYIHSKNSHRIKLTPDVLYHFKVTAVNHGGQSYPTEVLSALYHPQATKTVMIVNGFHRLASPAIKNTALEQGFDFDNDPGISYGPTLGWCGKQLNFDRTKIGREGENGLGWSGDELSGLLIAGNDFNYVTTHANAIKSANQYNIVSCSSSAIEQSLVNLQPYAMVDIIFGLQRNDGYSRQSYKTFTPLMQKAVRQYTNHGGALLISGSYVGSDMTTATDQDFLASVLKCKHERAIADSIGTVNGMGTTLQYYHQLNADHYAATHTDILNPLSPAFATLRYDAGGNAAIAYQGGDYRALTMGFPFECIVERTKRNAIMQGFLQFLIKE